MTFWARWVGGLKDVRGCEVVAGVSWSELQETKEHVVGWSWV